MPTLFTRIIEGEIPGTFVWSDDLCVAFLTIAPLREGHTLVVPRAEVDHWLDCPPELRCHLMGVASMIGAAIDDEWDPKKVALMIVGLEVPHLHIHLVPIWDEIQDLNFARARPADRADLESAAGRLTAALERAGHRPGL
jgi:diadenosine tetraphosphate (Ap4A) HIT family hydrolase